VVGRAGIDLAVDEQPLGPGAVLLEDALVEAERVLESLLPLLGAAAVLVADAVSGVCRPEEEQGEHEHGRQDDDQEGRDETADDVAEHVSSRFLDHEWPG
jgi:hypothetical protein